MLYVPLGVDDERYGVFCARARGERPRIHDEDQQLATLIAQRASIAVGNARLYERQREVARTLQAAFLPPALPRADGVRFDAVYAPGTRDLTVGGDWYDAFPLDDGTFAFSVGDVAGRGLDAAVPMGKMRQTFRALAVVEPDPARALCGCGRGAAPRALRRLRHRVRRHVRPAHARPALCERGPSAAVRARRGRDAVAAGGGRRSARLGNVRRAAHARASLVRGDLLIAFTDGLIESDARHRGRRTRARTGARASGVRFCSAPAALLRALVVPDDPGDDVAMLTLRAGGGADWSFDANDARAAQAARVEFVARLAAEGVGAEQRLAYEIVFGEIVGNAARYTPGPLDLALRRDGAKLVLAALDRGPGFGWAAALPANAWAESGRGLFLIDTLSHGVHIEHFGGFGSYLEITLVR